VTARAHQSLIWTRQRQVNQLRSGLREFYPGALGAFGADLAHPDAIAILTKAPTPELGRRLSTGQIAAALRRAGRQRNIDQRAGAIRDALRAPQAAAPPLVADAYGDATTALVGVIAALSVQIDGLETALAQRFEQHPDADIYRSLAGLGVSSSASGCSRSSETTRTATRMLKHAATTPAVPPSPSNPDAARSCSPGSCATIAWPTR